MPIVDPSWPRADVWLAAEAAEPDLVVVGVPSSKASLTPSRADLMPGEVRQRLHRFSTFNGESGVDLSGIGVRDMGNWPVSELDMHAMPPTVRSLAGALPSVPLTLFLGGDNAITRPLVRSLADDLAEVGVITFDAHHDVRSLENGPTNGTPIRGLIEEDGLPGPNVAQIGIHSFANSARYRSYCEDEGVHVFTVSDVESRGMPGVVGEALAALDHCSTIFVDVDVDVLDRAFAPGCPGARPGGLSVRQLSEGVRLLSTSPHVTAMDFVEVDPANDIAGITLDTVAHLVLTAATGLAERQHGTG